MKATVITSVLGVIGFGEDGKIAAYKLFPQNTSEIAAKLVDIDAGKNVSEISEVVKELEEKGFTKFVFENPALSRTVQAQLNVEVEVVSPSEVGENFRRKMGEYAVQTGFVKDASELSQWIHSVSMEVSQLKVRKATEKRDLMIVQAVQALDDMDKTLNLISTRIREWYGLHFPELDRLVEKHEVYANLVKNLGRKNEFTQENLEKLGVSQNKAAQIAKAAASSMGGDLRDRDIKQIQSLCHHILTLYDERANTEKYIEELMEEVAPNTSFLSGATLGARLIAIAGGLMNLAKMPASTIQVLGAEKALFRSLTTGARPPKHGIIFQHALIHGSKRWLRGKTARIFAGRLAIAVRTDAFSGTFIGDKLKADLEKRVDELQRKYPEPKPKTYEKRPPKAMGKMKPSRRRRKHGR
ncbi:MAG: C/D box methylation guide ribonucleoprotein complex aNOP56 subunit [Candidatus Bathyarchaeia archaeon]|nr:C/D box methylation guide ribonucleoprotein complex aNOP56 subunit [Candidatus Bathyarchaeota archaeon]